MVCTWDNGVKLNIRSWVDPEKNLLLLDWKLTGYGHDQQMSDEDIPAVYAVLSRMADPGADAYGAEYDLQHKAVFSAFTHLGGEPMDPPCVGTLPNGKLYVEQSCPGEKTFPEGFFCGITLWGNNCTEEAFPVHRGLAAVNCSPNDFQVRQGQFAIAVASGSSSETVQQKLQELRQSDLSRVRQAARRAAESFWRQSAISIPGERWVEDLYYANLHARRIANRRGTLPAPLFFPSTVGDYSLWHGDYHMNYNFQQPFYGDYGANHLEIGDSYFEAMKFCLQMGRLIAGRYYNSSGTFVQLSAYPIEAEDDVLGCAPMGRMVYCTGWAGHQYLWRYLYTWDREFLRKEGYPVLKTLAQFYLDFLTLESDGLYHAFPSNQGEDGFSGSVESYRDLPQNMLHIRFALSAAVFAASELGVDIEFQAMCRDRIARLANLKKSASCPRRANDNWEDVVADIDAKNLEYWTWNEILEERGELFPPEFLGWDGNIRRWKDPERPEYTQWNFYTNLWYAGKLPTVWMIELRNRCYRAGRDWKYIRKMLLKWQMPNGLLRAMARSMYGFPGAFTETTGILAPLQECLLYGAGKVMEVFPQVPKSWGDVSFSQLRVYGGFLVSAQLKNGEVAEVTIQSGANCAPEAQLKNPFHRGKCESSRSDAVLQNGIWRCPMGQNDLWVLKRK